MKKKKRKFRARKIKMLDFVCSLLYVDTNTDTHTHTNTQKDLYIHNNEKN